MIARTLGHTCRVLLGGVAVAIVLCCASSADAHGMHAGGGFTMHGGAAFVMHGGSSVMIGRSYAAPGYYRAPPVYYQATPQYQAPAPAYPSYPQAVVQPQYQDAAPAYPSDAQTVAPSPNDYTGDTDNDYRPAPAKRAPIKRLHWARDWARVAQHWQPPSNNGGNGHSPPNIGGNDHSPTVTDGLNSRFWWWVVLGVVAGIIMCGCWAALRELGLGQSPPAPTTPGFSYPGHLSAASTGSGYPGHPPQGPIKYFIPNN
jgi:hypothetical protein